MYKIKGLNWVILLFVNLHNTQSMYECYDIDSVLAASLVEILSIVENIWYGTEIITYCSSPISLFYKMQFKSLIKGIPHI